MPAAWVTAAASVGGLLMSASNSGSSGANNTSNAAADEAAKVGREQWEYYKQNYQPLETNLIKQATDAGSPDEFARNRGKANADVTGAFDTARKNTLNRLQSYGINPGSPAYQSAAASTDIAEGATKAGALTAADTNTRNLAYSKALDVAGLGRNIPAQSSASSANAANAATGASRNQFVQQQQNAQNVGYGINSIGNAARKWFGQPSSANYNSNGTIANPTSYGDTYSMADPAYGARGGKVSEHGIGYAEGGAVIDAEKTGDGQYDATALKGVLQKRGLNPSVAHRAAHGAAARHTGAITPHMRRFAAGGGVGQQGLESTDASDMGELQGPGTETSDSIPATIDGQQPAALSTGEVVVNADAVNLSGDEILQAINDAGLRKREAGLQPRAPNDVPMDAAPPNAATQAFRSGGRVSRFAHAGMGA